MDGCRSTSKSFKVLDFLLDEKLCSFENVLEALLLVECERPNSHPPSNGYRVPTAKYKMVSDQMHCCINSSDYFQKHFGPAPNHFESLSPMPGTSRPAC